MELQVKAQSAGTAGAAQPGDIIAVQPDGHPWGSFERLPKFWILKFPLVPVSQGEEYLKMWGDPLTGQVQAHHEYTLDPALLPADLANKLTTVGELVIRVDPYSGPADVNWGQFRNYIRNKRTGGTA